MCQRTRSARISDEGDKPRRSGGLFCSRLQRGSERKGDRMTAPTSFPAIKSLRTLALQAIYTADVRENCCEAAYNDAIVAAHEARENFMAALRIKTGIDDTLWRQLVKDVLP
jgi:hypothetical protein